MPPHLIFSFLRRSPALRSKGTHSRPARLARLAPAVLGGTVGTPRSPIRAHGAGHLPPRPPDRPPSLGPHYPFRSLVLVAENRPPAVARSLARLSPWLWGGWGCPRPRDPLSDLEAPTAGGRRATARHPLRGAGGGERSRAAAAVPGGVRLCAPGWVAAPGSGCAPRRAGQPGRRAGEQAQRPSRPGLARRRAISPLPPPLPPTPAGALPAPRRLPAPLPIELALRGRPSAVLLGAAHAAGGRRGVAATASRCSLAPAATPRPPPPTPLQPRGAPRSRRPWGCGGCGCGPETGRRSRGARGPRPPAWMSSAS